MNSKKIFSKLKVIESTLNLGDFKIEGIDVWPILRFQLVMGLNQNLKGAKSGSHHFSARILNKIKLLPNASYELVKIFLKSLVNPEKTRKKDLLFLSDSSAKRLKVEGKWYDVFIDPLIDHYSARGISHVTFETSQNFIFRTPSYRSTHNIAPTMIWLYLKSVFFRKKLQISDEFSKAYKNYVQLLQAEEFAKHTLSIEAIVKEVSYIKILSTYFVNLLKATDPEFVFVVPYNGYSGRAMCLASKICSIPSFDIQHGVQGAYHPAYKFFKSMPKKGFNTLPDYFLTWSESDSAAINEWGAGTDSVKAITIGNLILEKFQDQSDLALKLDKVFKNVFSGFSNKTFILITLQWGAYLPEIFEELLNCSSEDYFYLIRFHPSTTSSEKQKVENKIQQIKNRQIDIKHASSFPIYTLLRNTDLHITQSSTTVIEADKFQIKSIITGEIGKAYYEDYINEGKAFYASSANEILTLLWENKFSGSKKIKPETNSAPTYERAEVLDKIITIN